jgi:hypothetical protein
MVDVLNVPTGLRFRAPANWARQDRPGPGIFRIASGGADVSAWGYLRAEPLPKTRAQLAAARDALVRQAQARNASFRLTASRLTTVKGAPAIDLLGEQTILGKPVWTRSVHVFRDGEYVFEALAPAKDFALTNRRVMEPLLRSLRFRPLTPG